MYIIKVMMYTLFYRKDCVFIMIKIIITNELTNSYIPTPWQLSKEPWPAYRAEYQHGRVTLNFPSKFDITKPNKVVKTPKGMPLLVNCPEEEDENIGLLMVKGDFRGGIEMGHKTAEIIKDFGKDSKHCAPIWPMIVRFRTAGEYISFRTWRRSGEKEKFTAISFDKGFTGWDPSFEMFYSGEASYLDMDLTCC